MKTQIRINTTMVLIIFLLVITSCEKDEAKINKPVIDLHEVGIGNSHTAYIGSDLHLEAEITAEGKIDLVTVEIHQEEGSGEEIITTYNEFKGFKNTTFHKHVDIPAEGVEPGSYHLHLIVTDLEGNQATAEKELTIVELADETAPEIEITLAPENGKAFVNGETINISGKATDNTSLSGLLIALVREDSNISDKDVTGNNTSVIVMMHTHSFDNLKSHTFTASITVGAKNDNNMTPSPIQGDNAWRTGNYYILVKGKDAKGNWGYSGHYPIVIKL